MDQSGVYVWKNKTSYYSSITNNTPDTAVLKFSRKSPKHLSSTWETSLQKMIFLRVCAVFLSVCRSILCCLNISDNLIVHCNHCDFTFSLILKLFNILHRTFIFKKCHTYFISFTTSSTWRSLNTNITKSFWKKTTKTLYIKVWYSKFQKRTVTRYQGGALW